MPVSTQPVVDDMPVSIQPVVDDEPVSIEPVEGKPEWAKNWNDAEEGQTMIGGWADEPPMIAEPEPLPEPQIDYVPELTVDEPEEPKIEYNIPEKIIDEVAKPMPTIDEPEPLPEKKILPMPTIDEPEVLPEPIEYVPEPIVDPMPEPEVKVPEENFENGPKNEDILGDYVIDGYEGNKNDWHYVNLSWDVA